MTKFDLIARPAQHFHQLVAKDAEDAVKTIHGAMTQALKGASESRSAASAASA